MSEECLQELHHNFEFVSVTKEWDDDLLEEDSVKVVYDNNLMEEDSVKKEYDSDFMEEKFVKKERQENGKLKSLPVKLEAPEESMGHVKGLPLCPVCGDIVSGHHYGISTCEGCKLFFRRSIQREHQRYVSYVCRGGNGDCLVTKQQKGGCQACRLAKCLSVGMRREAVRVDLVRGGRRYPASKPPYSPNKELSVVKNTKSSSSNEAFSAFLTSMGVPGVRHILSAQQASRQRCKQGKATCPVCGDVVTGLHYGVPTCEGCKNFFRRSIQREYQGSPSIKCRNEGDCLVTKERRGGCQACRLAKCLSAGMRRDAVRVDLVRGGRRMPSTQPWYPPGKEGLLMKTDSSVIKSFIKTSTRVPGAVNAPPVERLPHPPQDLHISVHGGDVRRENIGDLVQHNSEIILPTLKVELAEDSMGLDNNVDSDCAQNESADSFAQANGEMMCPPVKIEIAKESVPCKQGKAPCPVCGGGVTGLHYGIPTCEGCKNFFKRSIQREYQGFPLNACRSGGDCLVAKQNRGGCQACRLAKCLGAGMRWDAVRVDQARGGRRMTAPTQPHHPPK